MNPKTALITGIRGQDGYYLAELLLAQGYRVFGTSHQKAAAASIEISATPVPVMQLDFASPGEIRALLEKIRPDEIYNFASRASSAQLFDNPMATSEVNGLAIVGFLEVLRSTLPKTRFCQASSSEVFANGKLSPQDEGTPMIPRNAYGAAKLFAHDMIGVYRARFGVFACSAILFNHESPRRGREYVTRKVTLAAAQIASGLGGPLGLGSLDSRRDWGYAPDFVRAMWLMLQQGQADDFVIATGHSHSVRDLCEIAFARAGLDYRDHVEGDENSARGPDTVELRGNPAKAQSTLGWGPSIPFAEMIGAMVDADRASLLRSPSVS